MASQSPLKILHVLNHIRDTGNGIVNATVDLACTQAQMGHDVAIASQGGHFAALLQKYGVQHFHLDQTRQFSNLPQMLYRYWKIVQIFQPDIVHTHMMTAVLLAWTHQQCSKLAGRRSCPFVATVHNEFQRNALVMGLADRVIAISQAVAIAMQNRGVSQSKIRVVLNGPLGSPRQENSVPQTLPDLQTPAIVTVAGMYERKGIAELIAAFGQISTKFTYAHLYIVGDGPDKARFEQQAQATICRDRIHFVGFQAHPISYMQQADIFVLASHREPFGLVLSEARSAGCAIIASDVDGIPEALDNGQAGRLVPPQDSQALAIALQEFLSSPQTIQEYQQRSQNHLERFTVTRVAEETMAVYERLAPIYSCCQALTDEPMGSQV